MSAAEQPTLMSLTNEMRNIGSASSRSLKDILADLKRIQGVTSAAPPAPAPAPPAAPAPAPPAPAPAPPAPAPAPAAPSVDPATKAAVDKVLGAWGTANAKGSGQRVIRDFSNAADNVPVDPSNASDQQRLGYAMDVLKGFSEAAPSFSDKAYKSWMPELSPFIETYKPAQEVFPLWKSTSDFTVTRYGGGPDDAYTYEEPAGVNYAQWEGVAKQLGYNGPIYGTVGYDIEGGGITGLDPQFTRFVDQKRAEGFDFVQYQPDSRNYRQKYGFRLPDGQVVGEYYGEGRDADVASFFKDFLLPVGTSILGIPGYGSSVTQSIGSAILPAEIATGIGSALNLSPEVLTGALGRGVINAGVQAALGGDASDVLRAGALPIAAPVVSSAVGQGLEALMPADIGVVAKPITDAAQSALTRGALAGIAGGDVSDVIGQSLLGSAAQAAGAEVGLSPKASQGLLDIVRSDGNINPVSLFQTAAEVSQSLSKPSTDIRAEGQDVDTGGGGDVDAADFSQLSDTSLDNQTVLRLPIDTSVEEPLLTTDILPGGLGALGQSIPFTGPPDPIDMGPTIRQQLYSDAGYGEGMTGEQTDVFDTVLADTGDVQAAAQAAIDVAPTTRSIRSPLRRAESRTEPVRQPTPVITPTYTDTFDFGLDAYGGDGGAGGDAGGADAAQTVRQQLYSDAGYGEGMTGGQTDVFDTVLADTGNVQAAAQAASETTAEMLARLRRQVYGDPAYGQAMTGAETQAFDETFNDVLTETGDVNKALNDAVLAADTAVMLIGPDGNQAEFQGPPDPALEEFRDQNPAVETIQVVGTRDPINIIDYQEQVGKDLADAQKGLDLIDYQEQVGKGLADAQKGLDVISLPVTKDDELGFDVVPDISDGYPPPASDEPIKTIDVVGKREPSTPSGLDPYEEKAFEEFLRQYDTEPYSHEGLNYLDPTSTQGSGGSPWNASAFAGPVQVTQDMTLPVDTSVEQPLLTDDTTLPVDTSVEQPLLTDEGGGGGGAGGGGAGGGGAGGGGGGAAGGGGGTTTPAKKGLDLGKLLALLALMGQKEPEAAQKPNVAQIPQRGLEALMYGFKPGSGPYG